MSETANALETEFRESMTGRLEKGYILPGQAQLLYPEKEIAGKLLQYRAVSLAALDAKSSLFKPDRRFEITVRSMPSYNNSFEALLKDLKRYKKMAAGCFCYVHPGPGRSVWQPICGSRS